MTRYRNVPYFENYKLVDDPQNTFFIGFIVQYFLTFFIEHPVFEFWKIEELFCMHTIIVNAPQVSFTFVSRYVDSGGDMWYCIRNLTVGCVCIAMTANSSISAILFVLNLTMKGSLMNLSPGSGYIWLSSTESRHFLNYIHSLNNS